MPHFFDLLIIILIIITAYPAVIFLYSVYKRPQSFEAQHKNIFKIISILLLLGTMTILWGSYIEPHILVINRQTVDIQYVDTTIKAVFITDFQIGTYKKTAWVQKTVDKILELHPDIIFIGGDHVDNAGENLQEFDYLQPLEQLAHNIPTYAIHGNHEYGVGGGKSRYDKKYQNANVSQETKYALEKLGIHYLTNDLEKITIKNQNLYIYGGDSLWAGKLDYSILQTREQQIPTIALIHNPSYIFETTVPDNLDLVLSGHTHGGQIRLPFIGPIGRVDHILPANYYQGLHATGNEHYLFVSSGVGETGARARLFNPPEIVELTIY